MQAGTWAEWFSAGGTILAAFGALYLLKREGEDRKQLQASEIRRASDDRRRQAAGVYLSSLRPGGSWTTHGERFQEYEATIANHSSGVINHIFLDLQRNPAVFSVMDDLLETVGIGRVLPGESRTVKRTAQAATSVWSDSSIPAYLGAELWFNDASGVPFHINDEHDVVEVDMNPRR